MRREFIASSLALATCATFTQRAAAQGAAPVAGKDYREIKPAVATADPKKIEVVEFFWYGCPHCFHLEPLLAQWLKTVPADVTFRKEHVGFPNAIKHQQLFVALTAMGIEKDMTPKIFEAIHTAKQNLVPQDAQASFLEKNGVDAKKFNDMYNSFSVKTKMRQAADLSDKFGLDSVPAFAVNGRYFTAPSMTGADKFFAVVDALIKQERARK
jgi:protein dithiol oxidoreductase (disulfide-forming)